VLDYNAEPLPNPHGQTRDYGLTLNFPKQRLVVSATKFETKSIGARPGSGVASRVFQIDFDTPYTTGTSLSLEHWLVGELSKIPANANLTLDQLITQADQLAGLTPTYLAAMRNNPTAITQDVTSRGYELEANYNPTRNLTVKFNASQTESIISAYGAGFTDFIAERMKLWTSIVSPFDKTTRFWDVTQETNKNGYATARDWFQNLVWNPMQLTLALQGLPQPQVRKYKFNTLASYRLAGLSERGWIKRSTVGGSLRWEDKGAIGFYGAAPVTDPANPDVGKVFVRSYDVNRPIYDPAHTYLDLYVAHDFRLFGDRIRARAQLNVRNVTEGGRLQAVGVNPDGSAFNFRIVDPREFVLSVRFDL
jgi:outer membrane receptor protein involved in Fe transport